MVVLTNSEELESDKAIDYSEELNYSPPSPLPPPRPSSSNSSVKYICDAIHILHAGDFKLALLMEYKIKDRGGALDVIPTGRLVRINEWVQRHDDFVDSRARNRALQFMHGDWDTVPPNVKLTQQFEPFQKQNEDIADQLIIELVDVQQFQLEYRGGAIGIIAEGVVSRINGSETNWGQLSNLTPEPELILQTNLSLRLWQGHRGQWAVDIRYGWNWLKIGTFKTAVGATLSSESVIRLRGDKDLFDYPFPKLFLNKNRKEPTRASRTGSPLLQSPPTEQQENPNDHFRLGCSEATGNDEFGAVGIGSESTVECEMVGARLNSGCLGKRKTKEKNPGGERRNKGKTNGVKIAIPLDYILQTKGMQLKDAAKHLKASPSALKQVHLVYNIDKRSPHEEYKLIGQSCPKEDGVIVKAKYGSNTIKFPLYGPWEMEKLDEQVKKRLPELEAGTCVIVYKDEEDGELILITCDEDLQLYIKTSILQAIPSTLKRVHLGYNTDKRENHVTVKVDYGSKTLLKFPLSRPWEKAKLEEEVKKRLPGYEAGTYLIKYKDEEAQGGELILIACDEDLELYIETSGGQGTSAGSPAHTIVVLLERK